MDYETYIKSILETIFCGYKDELIDVACKRICEYKGSKDNMIKYHDKLYKEITVSLKNNMRKNPGIMEPNYRDGLTDGCVMVLLKMDRIFKEMMEGNDEH